MENLIATSYHWVAAHQDGIENWEDLSLNEQLNVIVDSSEKRAPNANVVEQELSQVNSI